MPGGTDGTTSAAAGNGIGGSPSVRVHEHDADTGDSPTCRCFCRCCLCERKRSTALDWKQNVHESDRDETEIDARDTNDTVAGFRRIVGRNQISQNRSSWFPPRRTHPHQSARPANPVIGRHIVYMCVMSKICTTIDWLCTEWKVNQAFVGVPRKFRFKNETDK